MSTDTPHACSLSAAELPKRLAEMSAIGRDALLSVSPEGALRFRANRKTRARLDAIIAAESSCCSFLTFDLRDDEDDLVLTIGAPPDAAPLAWDLVHAFAAEARAA